MSEYMCNIFVPCSYVVLLLAWGCYGWMIGYVIEFLFDVLLE